MKTLLLIAIAFTACGVEPVSFTTKLGVNYTGDWDQAHAQKLEGYFLKNAQLAGFYPDQVYNGLKGYTIVVRHDLDSTGQFDNGAGSPKVGLTMCDTKTIDVSQDGRYDINDTLAHEFLHALQNCSVGWFVGGKLREEHANWTELHFYKVIEYTTIDSED